MARHSRVSTDSYLPFFIRLFVLFLAYFGTATLGLSIDPVGGFATLVWPPTGIALAALLLYGRNLWPAIAIAALLVNYAHGAPLFVALGIAAGNTLEALVAHYLLRKYANIRRSLDHLKDVLSFLFYAAILSTLVSSVIGTLSLLAGGVIASGALAMTWSSWWIGDMLGSAIMVPFALFWAKGFRERFSLRRTAEAILLFALLIVVGLAIFRGLFGIDPKVVPITYLLYLPLFFIALRFGPREYSAAIIVLALIAVLGSIQGYGIFSGERIAERLFYLQLFMGVTVFTFLPLAVLIQEKREFEKRKDEFLAIASHELKTPITTIKAYNDLLRRRTTDGTSSAKRYMTTIDDQVKNLTKLINDMLDITRINSGKIALGYERVAISELVKKTVHEVKRSTKNKNLYFVGGTSEIVSADTYKINQVLTNLLTNAIKYSDKKIIVKTKAVKGYIVVSVKDSGVGIEPHHQKAIFKRFYQVDSPDMQKGRGLGLGLYISYQIVRQHKGKMWVTSKYGKGSVFYFSLPRVKSKKDGVIPLKKLIPRISVSQRLLEKRRGYFKSP